MLQRHPRKISDEEFVFLSSRINTKDPQQVRGELRSWIRDNAIGALFNEPPSGYPRVINYLLRTAVVFAAAPKERHGNQIFSTLTKIWVSSRRSQSVKNGELVLLYRIDVGRRM
eukprot:5748818-Karenia_brevis.AAC.1